MQAITKEVQDSPKLNVFDDLTYIFTQQLNNKFPDRRVSMYFQNISSFHNPCSVRIDYCGCTLHEYTHIFVKVWGKFAINWLIHL